MESREALARFIDAPKLGTVNIEDPGRSAGEVIG
jgi:hypothetical protein